MSQKKRIAFTHLKNLIKILKSYCKAMIILTQTYSVSVGSLRFATAEFGQKLPNWRCYVERVT